MTRTTRVSPLRPASAPSRRLSSRVDSPENAWVYWQCQGREEIAHVRNMSLGGLFIETPQPLQVGTVTRLDFLVQERSICVEAVVRHATAGTGLGLEFKALSEQDRPKLAALLARLGSEQSVRRP